MKINHILSRSNPLVKRIVSLHQRQHREELGLFLIEGPKILAEAVGKGVRIKDVVVSERFQEEHLAVLGTLNIDSAFLLKDSLFKELTDTVNPQGIIATAYIPKQIPGRTFATETSLILIAHAIQDPGNVGTIIRTGYAAGATGIFLTTGCADPFSPKVVRSAAGALFSLPLIWNISFEETIKLLKKHDIVVIACDQRASSYFFEINLVSPLAFVFGNEGQGLSEDIMTHVDQSVAIPMREGCESLNVAAAAAIMLFAAVQQRLQFPATVRKLE